MMSDRAALEAIRARLDEKLDLVADEADRNGWTPALRQERDDLARQVNEIDAEIGRPE
jgi:hypothetical protein